MLRLLKTLAPALILLLGVAAVPTPGAAAVSVGISVGIAPPLLPVYEQPPIPGPGYIWVPGYWAWGPEGYYWVPGTWVLAPEPGVLWTPGYWGWSAGLYYWHPGYWGPTVGFYGGIPYGYGYTGVGYQGGYWRGRDFYYNRTVNNVNVTNVTNVYNTTVINNNTTVNRVSYNGGPGGIVARPTRREEVAAGQRHFSPTSAQVQHQTIARSNRDLLASVNHGKPTIAATARPTEFNRGIVAATRAGGAYRAPRGNVAEAGTNSVPRPGSVSRPGNVARPENPRRDNSMRSSVPRPPTSNRETGAAHNDNMASPRSQPPRPSNAYRPSGEARTGNVPRPGMNQAGNASRPQGYSRPEEASRQPNRYSAPRPQSQPRPQAGQNVPQPRSTSRPQEASRQPSHYSAPQPRPQAQQERQPQPHPEGHPQGESRGDRPQR